MEAHQQRVVTEQEELGGKIDRLKDFIQHSPIFKTLDVAEQERLGRQLVHMCDYFRVLGERIQAFAA